MPTREDKPLPPPCDRHLWQFVWVRDLAFLAVVVLLLLLAYHVRSITAPVLLGITLAYVFNPLITWADKQKRIPRWCSAAGVVIVAGAGFIGAMVWIVPRLISQIVALVTSLPKYARSVADKAGIQIDLKQLQQDALDTVTRITEGKFSIGAAKDLVTPAKNVVGDIFSEVFTVLMRVVDLITYSALASIVVAFCFFFFSWKWGPFLEWAEQFIPQSSKHQTNHILRRMDETVSGFIRGRLIQALIMGVLLSVGWWIAGVPYWLLLGLLSGMLNLAPFAAVVGWIAAVVLAMLHHLAGISAENLMATTQALDEAARAAGIAVDQLSDDQRATALASVTMTSFNFMVLIWPSLIYLVAQLLDGWVVEPLVQGAAVNLDPLTVVLAVLVGGTLAGMLGLLLAIPVAACGKILAQEVVIPRLKSYAEEN